LANSIKSNATDFGRLFFLPQGPGRCGLFCFIAEIAQKFWRQCMTIFSKIIAGEIPSYKIAENERFYAFLDIFPAALGHTLVVPKIETDKLFDLPNDYLDGYLTFCKPIAQAIQQVTHCNRVNILTIGFEVPHAHIHLLPMNGMGDADILSRKIKMSADELKAVQVQLLSRLAVQ
jgi:histidine triad (HIT) family protein